MVFKINISHKGKTYKIESEDEFLIGKSLGDKIGGKEIKPELEGYELEITGGSDKAGFAMYAKIEGIGLRKVLLEKGWGMQKRSRGDKKKVPQPAGLRRRKSYRGRTISEHIVQINMNVVKEGKKPLAEIFAPPKEEAPAEGAGEGEAPKAEEKKVEAAPAA